MLRQRLIVLTALISLVPLAPCAEPSAAKDAQSRTFSFTYQATLEGLSINQKARIWLPVATSNEGQEVTILSKTLPGREQIHKDDQYGNQILYVEATGNGIDPITVAVNYRVRRREVKADATKHGNDMEKVA